MIVDVRVRVPDKNLAVSISGDVDEAKALSRPPEDSQGTNVLLCACFIKNGFLIIIIIIILLL